MTKKKAVLVVLLTLLLVTIWPVSAVDQWTLSVDVPENEGYFNSIYSLATYNGKFYAGSSNGFIYVYDGVSWCSIRLFLHGTSTTYMSALISRRPS